MDSSRLADWVTIHDHLVGNPPRRLEKGSQLTQCLKLAGRRFKVRWTVVENDPCRQVVWEGRGPVGSHARVEYRFEPGDGGTRFSVPEPVRPSRAARSVRLAERTVARATGKELAGSLKRLKALVE